MEFGTNCHLSTCLHLSFLPLSCPYCHHSFCESHFLPRQHACTAPGSADNVLSSNEVLKRVLRANPSARLPCQKRGCKNFSLEVGKESSEGAQARVVVKDGTDLQTPGRAFEHAAPTCVNCKGLYCMGHVAPRAHDCQAPPPPTEGQQRMNAAEERKRKAREILSKNFANRGASASTKK
ncbi:hypothetical protein BCV69DRAFT_286581 [Microstroma glucosiphilum]|uniref:AN1-type domain-containing protein n=1 Tax=Pseudomicrostroma glucosiphilum TaxID=1684307 RepID=A0A316UDU7_9BASI|nr:hypothetical protein BCV69DRAFT_286581 [Pseudomicrostroma glucosiphilum]PWN23386.1 hypothetical protein BCV69DRAFT_286581 [Pseudomicrostroma glucosiphilum]